MFLHHTMTDAEILRSCEGCTSPHLRLVADRLRDRVETLARINATATKAIQSHGAVGHIVALREIIDESKPEGIEL